MNIGTSFFYLHDKYASHISVFELLTYFLHAACKPITVWEIIMVSQIICALDVVRMDFDRNFGRVIVIAQESFHNIIISGTIIILINHTFAQCCREWKTLFRSGVVKLSKRRSIGTKRPWCPNYTHIEASCFICEQTANYQRIVTPVLNLQPKQFPTGFLVFLRARIGAWA